jgi:hypothetical protein
MKMFASAKYALGVTTAVALLAGCSAGGSQLAPSSPMGANGAHQIMSGNHTKVSAKLALLSPSSVKVKLHKVPKNLKPVKPNCCALQKTAVITDAIGGSSYAGAVYMFDYNSGAFLGTVSAPPEGWLEPQGACTDTSGNFYVANTAMSTVDEYTHSGSFVMAISDPGQYPVGCSYDKSSGTLAISNIISVYGGAGSVSVAQGGTITNTYYPSNMSRVYFLAYEGKTGTLWLDGSDYSGFFQYDSMSSNGTFTSVGVHGATVNFPGGVQWSGKTNSMNVGDQSGSSGFSVVYQVDDSGNVTGTTDLDGSCDVVQYTIKGPGLVAPDACFADATRYKYPQGGNAILTYSGAPFLEPIGSAVSPDKGGS